MISRIRIDAYGKTPNEVADTLYPHADEIEKLLGVSVSRGECVIERNISEGDDSDCAFKGRLNLHPDINGWLSPAKMAVDFSNSGTAYYDPRSQSTVDAENASATK